MKFLISSLLILGYMMSSSVALKNEVCGLPHSVQGAKENGLMCLARHPNFSYDSKAKKCVFFEYGGCGGNDNRFRSEEECKEKCVE